MDRGACWAIVHGGSRLDMIEVTKPPPPPPRNLLNFPGDSVIKNLPANAGDAGLVSRLERSLKKEMATHSFSCLGNPMVRGAWKATVHEIAKELDMT